MKDIAIYGAGGLGREVFCLIQRINQKTPTWNVVGFFDDTKEKGSSNEYGKMLGGINDLNLWPTKLNLVLAIGLRTNVKKIVSNIENEKIEYPNIIVGVAIDDPDSFLIGKGNILRDGCSFTCNSIVGDFNLMNGDVKFGHDDRVGNFNTFMPGVKISGEVVIGDENFFGVGSIVLQKIKISNNVKLGAGSVLMHKPKDGSLYIGVPAKLFKY